MNLRRTISNIALMMLFIIYIAGLFTGKQFNVFTASAGAAVLVLNLPYMGKTFRLPAWIFCGLGILILLISGAPAKSWADGINSMMKTVIILIAVQMLSIAIKAGGYENAVSNYMNRGIKKVSVLFIILLLLSHLLAGVMSLGSVVIILSAVMPAIKGRIDKENRFAAEAITIGYCTLFLWAPGTVTVLMSMQVFELGWSQYFVPAFMLAVLGLAMGCVWGIIRYGKIRFNNEFINADSTETTCPAANDFSGRRKIAEMALVMTIIVVGITALERLGFSNATGRMIVVSVSVALIWVVLVTKNKFISIVPGIWWNEKLPNNVDLYTFFLSMGMFSAAVSYSGIERRLIDLCGYYQGFFEMWVLPALPLLIIGLSLVGIHPFISVLVVGPVLMGMHLPVSPLQLGLAMSLGCGLSYMVSPFAGLILTLAGNLKLSPADICFKINLRFAVLYYAAAELLIHFIRH
ncbi:MAG: hypothetical protein PUC98_06995 [Clostridiales bacterium]|nr:hypothetical protein [Clostridiales bacterium]